MKKILLQNGCTMNWGSGELVSQDVLIEEGYIRSISTTIPMREEYEVIDVAGKLVSAGLIDMHVHLREPGDIHKETIKTGLQAVATGGFTTVACMPNTRPVADSVETVKMICDRANEIDAARVLPIAAITVRELGEELTDMTLLKKAGVIGFSDDGVGVQSSRVMKEAMKKAKDLGMPIIAHCEDDSLAKGGCVHEGVFSRKFALQGIPSVAESVQVARDILLAEEAGVHYHVCHISTKESVRLVREAKARGQNVTTEVTPHHLLLCEEDIPGLDSLYKMNPPLRSKADQEALIEGVLDGTIDMIATDHAPHTLEEKEVGMERAPFGIVGLETAFPLLYTHLVLRGILSLADLLQRMTVRPAEVFGLPYGRLREGEIADIVVIDLEKEERIDPESFLSKGKNTPFAGWLVKGWPVMTMVNGKMVWKQEELSAANCVEA